MQDAIPPAHDVIPATTEAGTGGLRALRRDDHLQVAEVYRDAVTNQAATLYSPEQIRAWAAHTEANPGFQDILQRGHGLVSCATADPTTIEAFAVLDPADRLALLYCRGRSARQGRATALLQALEHRAREQGCLRLRTEASQLSRPLLERQGWWVEAEETAFYAGVAFQRWRMIRELP